MRRLPNPIRITEKNSQAIDQSVLIMQYIASKHFVHPYSNHSYGIKIYVAWTGDWFGGLSPQAPRAVDRI